VQLPRRAHAGWTAPASRRDPISVLEAQARDRLPDLVGIRYGRMLASSFAFYRGSAAIMAMDLGGMPSSGLTVQLCGDAHLANFGLYASPERALVFDVNDFDETLPGPFEWDVKRLAASFVVAARANHFGDEDSRATALAAVASYRLAMRRFAALGNLAIWYTHLTVDDITGMLANARQQRNSQSWILKARSNTSLRALAKLTTVVNGRRRIVDHPPLIERLPPELVADDIGSRLTHAFDDYVKGLDPERQHLLEQYTAVDVARKVVGVGSVGTRCYIVLLEGRDLHDPLFLQVKEAQASVLEAYAGKSVYANNGQRVVVGQRRMQAASDIFLGWVRGAEGRDFYWRQLQDLKGSVPIESVAPAGLTLYAHVCGQTLARAHARTGDSVQIAAYLGASSRFDEAVASFAMDYADQTEKDYQRLVASYKEGRIHALLGK
jgi:uncharacterized protein (DUF2252 family)